MAGIPALVAEIGFKALAGRALGKAASGVKAAGHWLGSLDVIHLLALGLAIGFAYEFVLINGLAFRLIPFIGPRIHIVSLNGQIADAKADTAKARAELATSRANETTLKNSLAKQNAAVADLGAKSAQQQKAGAQASQVAAGRANEAQATSDRLKQSSRSAGLKSVPVCEPSDTLKGQWK